MGAMLLGLSCAMYAKRSLLYAGAAILPVAVVLDLLDGHIGRRRGKPSALGRDLDSLSDLISFGVAPAVLAFAAGLRDWAGVAALLFFVSCGLCRLARYNATAQQLTNKTGKVAYFEGTPITFGLVPLAVALALNAMDRLQHPMTYLSAGLFAMSGCAMISKTIRIPKP
jgi:CDP-diacylglycerol--serine O-phosphatidyltransferase